MTASNFPIVIAEWDRNDREVVRVSLDQYGGRHTIDCRTWYWSGDQLKPGRSGITLAVKHLPALAQALAQAEQQARDLGLIETSTDSRSSTRVRDRSDDGGGGGG